MADLDPIKPAYPGLPLRPVDKGEKREDRSKRQPQPEKKPGEQDGDRPQLDEYA